MIEDDPRLLPCYRMPRVFGALPGPRNLPLDKQDMPNRQTSIIASITFRTDGEHPASLLPPACEPDGPPLLTVSRHEMSNIRWLAGYGYAMLVVSLAMKHRDPKGQWRRGEFVPVLWENLADPIITGREEPGLPQLYADIPPLGISGGNCIAGAPGRHAAAVPHRQFSRRDASRRDPLGKPHAHRDPRIARSIHHSWRSAASASRRITA